MKRTLLTASALAMSAAWATLAVASSHREAPMIAGMPRLDASDFYMFRSYEPGRENYVTMIADYVPLQDPGGGPNFYQMETNGYYDINVDSNGTGRPTFTFRFRFSDVDRGLSVSVGGKNVPIPLINDGSISTSSRMAQNVVESYTVSLVTYSSAGVPTETPLSGVGGATRFLKPVDNIGDKSVPNYTEYAERFTYALNIPGCGGQGRLFVGQRKDPFVVNLGETFDLLNYAHPVGDQYDNSAMDDLAGNNVTSIVWEVPAACLAATGDPVVGAWTTSSLGIPGPNGSVTYQQVSYIGPGGVIFEKSMPSESAPHHTSTGPPPSLALVQMPPLYSHKKCGRLACWHQHPRAQTDRCSCH
jgi:hypothetical protein